MLRPVPRRACLLLAVIALQREAHAQQPDARPGGPTTAASPEPPAAEAPLPASEPPPPVAPAPAAAPPAPAPYSTTAAKPSAAAAVPSAAPQPDAGLAEIEWPAPERRTRRSQDAHADRVILFPTAETHPKDSFFISSYELVFIQLGYALTDDLQLSALFLPPIVRDQPLVFLPTLKLNVARGEQGNVALLGGLDFVGQDEDSVVLGRLGAAGQLCFDAVCNSSISVNSLAWTDIGDGGGTIVLLGAGGVVRASDLVSLLIEPSYALFSDGDRVETPRGFVLSYGVRMSGAQFGFDITFVRPFVEDFENELILGIPFVVASYRSN